MNAHVERFNRTLQEEFVEEHEDLLWTDLPRFNRRLWDYLARYNRERPHHGLGLRAPLAALNDACPPESRICWRDTSRPASCSSVRPADAARSVPTQIHFLCCAQDRNVSTSTVFPAPPSSASRGFWRMTSSCSSNFSNC